MPQEQPDERPHWSLQAAVHEIFIHGEKVSFNSPRDAIAKGIGMVHQHFMLVENQTVTENVLIGPDNPRSSVSTSKNMTMRLGSG